MWSSHLSVSAKEEGVGSAAARDFLCVSRQNGVDGRIWIPNRRKGLWQPEFLAGCPGVLLFGCHSSDSESAPLFSFASCTPIRPVCRPFGWEVLLPCPSLFILPTSFLMCLFQFLYAIQANLKTCSNFPLYHCIGFLWILKQI